MTHHDKDIGVCMWFNLCRHGVSNVNEASLKAYDAGKLAKSLQCHFQHHARRFSRRQLKISQYRGIMFQLQVDYDVQKISCDAAFCYERSLCESFLYFTGVLY